MDRGGHRSEAEDDPRLLAESVGVGVAEIDGGELGCGRRGSVVHGSGAGLEVEQSKALGMLYWVL